MEEKNCPFRKGFAEDKEETVLRSYKETFLPCLKIKCMAYDKETKECLLCRRHPPTVNNKQTLPWF